MRHSFPGMRAFALPVLISWLLPAFGAAAQTPPPPPQPDRALEQKRDANEIAVSLVVSDLACTCARFAEDIRNVVNDIRPGGMRVLPILGVGGFQNVNDILFLRGVDMGTVDQDTVKLLKARDPALYKGLEQKLHYITKLYNSELHILAKKEVRSLADLKGRPVNFGPRDGQTHVTADNIFAMLQIPAQKTHFDNDQALQMVMSGEIAAMIVLTGAPQAGLANIRREDGLHFVPVGEASLPRRALDQVLEEYLPAELTADLYPNLVEPGAPVPTLANRALLVTYAWPEESERYRRVARFVQELFGRIDQFRDRSRHPKWREINLAAEVPGWTRFKAARQWLGGKRTLVAAAPIPSAEDDIKTAFQTFLDDYQASTGRTLSPPEKDTLYTEFKQYMDGRALRRALR